MVTITRRMMVSFSVQCSSIFILSFQRLRKNYVKIPHSKGLFTHLGVQLLQQSNISDARSNEQNSELCCKNQNCEISKEIMLAGSTVCSFARPIVP
jgi:hypothetical protein